jgi:hypothetical protein
MQVVKIQHVMTQIVELPANESLADGPMIEGATGPFVLVKLATGDGVEGIGVTFFGGGMTRALKQAVDDLGELILGEDPGATRADRDQVAGCVRHVGSWWRLHVGIVGNRYGALGYTGEATVGLRVTTTRRAP